MRIDAARRLSAAAGLLTVAVLAHGQAPPSRHLPEVARAQTALQFGPDARLYVADGSALLQAHTIARSARGHYTVIDSETIRLIRDVEIDDDGGACAADCVLLRVTGLRVGGTLADPQVYVLWSEPRSAPADSSALDAGSGTLSRLRCSTTLVSGRCADGGWQRVDLLRGLPRSPEHHTANALALDAGSHILHLTVAGDAGGLAGRGGPSASGQPHTGALLAIDLEALRMIEMGGAGNPDDPDGGAPVLFDLLAPDASSLADGGYTHRPVDAWLSGGATLFARDHALDPVLPLPPVGAWLPAEPPTGTGDVPLAGRCKAPWTDISTLPLNMAMQGDDGAFPGTVWVGRDDARGISVLEPVDIPVRGGPTSMDDPGIGTHGSTGRIPQRAGHGCAGASAAAPARGSGQVLAAAGVPAAPGLAAEGLGALR